MFLKKTLASANGMTVKSDEVRSSKTTNARTPNAQAKPLNTARNYLPGLRPVEIDFEVYFKDAFFGQTF
jgi:hypothetical protein